MELTFSVNNTKFTYQTGTIIKACNMLIEKMESQAHFQFHTKIKLSNVKSSKTVYNYIDLLTNTGIIKESEPSRVGIFGEPLGTPATYLVNKTIFCILYTTVSLLDVLSREDVKEIRRQLRKLNQDIDIELIVETIKSVVLDNAPLPYNGRDSNYFYDVFYKVFFEGLFEYTENNLTKFDECYFWNIVPLFRYSLKELTKEKLNKLYGSTSNSMFIIPMSLLTDCKFWEKIPEYLMLNKSSTTEKEKKSNGEYKFPIENLHELKEPDIPETIKDEIRSKINIDYLNEFKIHNTDFIEYMYTPHTHRKVAQYLAWYVAHESTIIKKLWSISRRIKEKSYQFALNLTVHICKENEEYTFKLTTRQTSPFVLEKKEMRIEALESNWGETLSYDFSSCCFMIARLLNKGEFSVEWNLKNIIVNSGIKKYQDGKLVPIKRDDLRQLPYRLFNYQGEDYVECFKNAYSTEYKKKYKNPFYVVEMPKLPEESTTKIVEIVYRECGDWHALKNIIYFLESAIELSIVYKMISKGYAIANVFDEFFFRKKQVTENKFHKIVQQTMKGFLKEIEKYCPALLPFEDRIQKGKLVTQDSGLIIHYLMYSLINNMKYGKLFFEKEYYAPYFDDNGELQSVYVGKTLTKKMRKTLKDEFVIRLQYDPETKKRFYVINWEMFKYFLDNCFTEQIINRSELKTIKNRIKLEFPQEYNDYFVS